MAVPLVLIIRYISTALSGFLLMMWGMINFALQLRMHYAFPKVEDEEIGDMVRTGWNYSWTMAAVASLVPFIVGVLLIRTVMKEASRAKKLMG